MNNRVDAGPNRSGRENGNNNDERLPNFNVQYKPVIDLVLIKEEPSFDWYNCGSSVADTSQELSGGQFEEMMNPNYLNLENFTSGLLSYDDDNFEMVLTADRFNLQQPEQGVNENGLGEHCGSSTEDTNTNNSGGTTESQLTLVTANQAPSSVSSTVDAKPGTSSEANISMDNIVLVTTTNNGKNRFPSEPTFYKKLTQLRPRQRKAPKKPVADDQKDQTYFDKRAQNTLAARRCRQKKRELDEQRDSLIKKLMAEKEQLTQTFDELSKKAETCKRLQEENSLLKLMLRSELTKSTERA